MPRQNHRVGEVRTAPNGNTYALISFERTKGRVALLLVNSKNTQSPETTLMTIQSDAWSRWRRLEGVDESMKITDTVRREAYALLHELPDPRYQK